MDKAEQRALEAYPPKMRYVGIDSVKDDRKIDVNKPMRDRYVKAYHQAEKDLELTWEDIETIQEMANKYCKHHSCEPRFFVYKEVLKRLKERKEK